MTRGYFKIRQSKIFSVETAQTRILALKIHYYNTSCNNQGALLTYRGCSGRKDMTQRLKVVPARLGSGLELEVRTGDLCGSDLGPWTWVLGGSDLGPRFHFNEYNAVTVGNSGAI